MQSLGATGLLFTAVPVVGIAGGLIGLGAYGISRLVRGNNGGHHGEHHHRDDHHHGGDDHDGGDDHHGGDEREDRHKHDNDKQAASHVSHDENKRLSD